MIDSHELPQHIPLPGRIADPLAGLSFAPKHDRAGAEKDARRFAQNLMVNVLEAQDHERFPGQVCVASVAEMLAESKLPFRAIVRWMSGGRLGDYTKEDVQSSYVRELWGQLEAQGLQLSIRWWPRFETLQGSSLLAGIFFPRDHLTLFPCLKPAWSTDTVVALARSMIDQRNYSALPILADALNDAGCSNELLLTYCRGNNGCPHSDTATRHILQRLVKPSAA
jgi:hypothetical protein